MSNKNVARITAFSLLGVGLALAFWIWPDDNEPSRLMLGLARHLHARGVH